jgi:hypothetical protein
MWTPEIESDVKYIGDCARGYLWMYRRDVRQYSQYHKILSNSIMLLAVLGPGLVALGVGLREEKVLSTFGLVISFLVGVGEGIVRNFEFETKVANLKRQASKFSGLVNNIRRQLLSPPEQREDPNSYQTWIAKNYDDLVDAAVDISDTTYSEYEKTASVHGLPVPDSITELNAIKVNSIGKEEEKDGEKRLHVRAPTRIRKLSVANTPPPSLDNVRVGSNTPPDNTRSRSDTNSSPTREGIKFSDEHMKYELQRLQGHVEADK